MSGMQVHDLYGTMSESSAMRLLAMNDRPEPRRSARFSVDARASSAVTGVSGADGSPDDRSICALRFRTGACGFCCEFIGAEDQHPAGPRDGRGLRPPAEGISELKLLAEGGRAPVCRVDSAELLPPSFPDDGTAELVLRLSRNRIADRITLGTVIPEKITFFVRSA